MVDHPNIVKLLGYCADDDNERGIQRLLIYEFMPNGSVEDHLFTRSRVTLSWSMRLRIARDTALGLTYLHERITYFYLSWSLVPLPPVFHYLKSVFFFLFLLIFYRSYFEISNPRIFF